MNPHPILRAILDSLAPYYPNKLPQVTTAPVWPMIRGTVIGRSNAIDACGAGEESEEDITVQLDFFAKTYNETTALRSAARALLAAASPPWIKQPGGFEDFDEDAKVERASAEWTLYQSTP